MQINCQYCHKPYGLSKEIIFQALDQLSIAGQSHYNAVCPHCGRMNKVGKSALMRSAPDWVKPKEEEE